MKIRSRMTGAALVLMLSMGGALAACGGDSDSDDGGEPTSAPSASADTEPTADSGDDSSSAGKPSKDDVVAGYKKILTGTQSGLPDDIVDKVVTCFVDELYDPASPKTLNAIADADATGVDPNDAKLFTDASTTCTKKITG